MRRKLTIAIALAAVLAPAGLSAADPIDPQIFDLAGDANTIQGTSVQTAPVSYDPGDILSVTVQSSYSATPVGEDGIDYEGTGLIIRFDTTAPPASPGPSMEFWLGGVVSGCTVRIAGYISGDLTGAEDLRPGTAEIYRQTNCDDPVLQTLTLYQPASWSTEVDQETGDLVITAPFAGLDAAAAEVLRPGTSFGQPMGWVFFSPCVPVVGGAGSCDTIHIDHSPSATSAFTLGDDIPSDVPCTRGCPQAGP